MSCRLPHGAGLLAVWLVSAAFSIQPVATPTPRPTPTRPPTPAPTPRPTPRQTAAPTPTPVPAAISLSADALIAGTVLTVGGTGFDAGRQVTIYLDVPELAIGTAGADVRGTFRQDVLVPETASAGMHEVCAQRQPQPVCTPLQVLAPATPASADSLPSSAGDPPAAGSSRSGPPSPLALLAAAPVIALLAALAVLHRRRRLARALRPGQPWTPPGS